MSTYMTNDPTLDAIIADMRTRLATTVGELETIEARRHVLVDERSRLTKALDALEPPEKVETPQAAPKTAHKGRRRTRQSKRVDILPGSRAELIVADIAAHPGTTNTEVAGRIDVDVTSVTKLVKALAGQGVIHREGGGGRNPARLTISNALSVVPDIPPQRRRRSGQSAVPVRERRSTSGAGKTRAQRILEYLESRPGEGLTATEIGEAIDVENTHVNHVVARLLKDGEVIVSGKKDAPRSDGRRGTPARTFSLPASTEVNAA